MKIKEFYGFDHKKVLEIYNGAFIGEFQIKTPDGKWSGVPVAMYKANNPDRSKGHKDFFYLFMDNAGRTCVGGLESDQLEEIRHQAAIHCTKCDSVRYSRYRHDCVSCECGECSIDGGRDYTRVIGNPDIVTIDLLTGKIE